MKVALNISNKISNKIFSTLTAPLAKKNRLKQINVESTLNCHKKTKHPKNLQLNVKHVNLLNKQSTETGHQLLTSYK